MRLKSGTWRDDENREKMVEFYQKIFAEPNEVWRSDFMSDGDVNVALIEVKREDQQEGINHFGFEVDDLDDIKRRLSERGFCEIDSRSRIRTQTTASRI
jgi:hypothetical protein